MPQLISRERLSEAFFVTLRELFCPRFAQAMTVWPAASNDRCDHGFLRPEAAEMGELGIRAKSLDLAWALLQPPDPRAEAP